MSKAKNKTVASGADAEAFINGLEHNKRKQDSQWLLQVMQDICSEPPVLWGPSIVGFGDYHYKYESGREGDFFRVGFSPRKQNLTVYVMPGFSEVEDLLEKLGKHKTGKSCLYINKLEDVDTDVLKKIVERSYQIMNERYG